MVRRRQTRRRSNKGKRTQTQRQTRGGNYMNVYFPQSDGYEPINVIGQHLSLEETRLMPVVEFRKAPRTVYIVAMYDNEAPQPAYLHMLERITDTYPIYYWRYKRPNPPEGELHTYTIDLLSKTLESDTALWSCLFPRSRRQFNIDAFIDANGLRLEARINFICGNL